MASTREDEEAVLLPRSENNGSSNGSSNDGAGSVGAGPRSPDIQRNGSKAVTRQRREWPTKAGSKKSLKRTLLLLGLVVALITSGVINSILMKMVKATAPQLHAPLCCVCICHAGPVLSAAGLSGWSPLALSPLHSSLQTSDLYTQRFAFFVDQGNNIVYVSLLLR